MTHTEYTWQLANTKIFAQSWMPDGQPKTIICLVHGMGEHSGRYKHWAKLFVDAGYGLISTDFFGHGKTEGKTGHVKSYQLLLDQVNLLLQKAEELFPDAPRILYGHSMGGNVAINYAISKDPPVSGIIASAPWLRLVIPVSGAEKIASKMANAILPGLLINAKGLGAEKLSDDPEHWAEVRSDPLVHRKISAKYAYEMMNKGEFALRHVYKINKPFLLMHGNADEITSHKASENFVANTSERTELKIWDGFRHELHNHLDYKEVFKYVVNWIENLKLTQKGPQ